MQNGSLVTKWLNKILFISIFHSFNINAYAADLMDVYRQALESDPVYKSQEAQFMANKEVIGEARAALLPQMLATAVVSRNRIDVFARSPAGPPINVDQSYNSQVWQVSANQTIFNYQAWANLLQAKASVKAASATLHDASQNLMLRTAQQYFKVLLTQDTLNFAEAKLRANTRQLEQARARYEVGLDPITSVYEAQSAHDQSVADVIVARNNQLNENENLRKLTNRLYEHIAPLRDNKIPLIKPEPSEPGAWISTGIKQNYALLAAKYNLQSARESLKSQAAANWPTFQLQTSKYKLINSDLNSNFFVPAYQSVETIAIAANFPFYQGGLVEARTRQAQYNFQTISAQLESVYRDVIVNTRISFNSIIDGISRINADRQTVISRQNTAESTEAQYRVGTRTMVDVVNAQQRLFEAQEQLARDQYNLINSILNLKYLAGTLCVSDLEEINSWLKTVRINALPPCDDCGKEHKKLLLNNKVK